MLRNKLEENAKIVVDTVKGGRGREGGRRWHSLRAREKGKREEEGGEALWNSGGNVAASQLFAWTAGLDEGR